MRRISCLVLCLLALGVLPAARGAEVLPTFGEVVDVRVINVEVVVTDREGKRVHGLPPDAFTLKVDRKVVDIQYFTEVREGLAIGPPEGAGMVGSVESGAPVGTSFLVFVDDAFSRGPDRDRVLEEVRASLSSLGARDEVAIVAWDGRRVETLTPWTQSRPHIDAALDRAGDRSTGGLIQEFNRREGLIDRRDGDGGPASGPTETGLSLGFPPERRALELARDLQRTTSAVAGAMRGFAGPATGRKVLVLLAGGWPFDPYAAVTGNPGANPNQRIPSGRELLAPMLEAANLLSYTIYGVDTPGLNQAGGADASLGVNTREFDTWNEREDHDTLQFAAADTGGQALINAERVTALSAPIEDTRTYYWLGVGLDRRGDGKAQKIEVEVQGEGLEVRARKGFVDLSREAEVALTLESALSYGESTLPDASLRVEIGAPKKSGARRMKVPVSILLPFDDVTIQPAGKAWKLELELRVAALDEEGGLSEVPLVPLKIDLPTRPEPGQFAWYDTELVLRRAEQDVILALVDPRTLRLIASPAQRVGTPR